MPKKNKTLEALVKAKKGLFVKPDKIIEPPPQPRHRGTTKREKKVIDR